MKSQLLPAAPGRKFPRHRGFRFEVDKTPRGWWVRWSQGGDIVAGPYELRRSATYVAGLLNETLEAEPLGLTPAN